MKSHLLVWKLLLPVVMGGLLFVVCVDPDRFENFRRGRMFTKQLEDVRFGPNENGILIIGNSLLQHALPPERVITRRMNLEMMKKTGYQSHLNVSTIAVPGLPTAELKKNREKILALHPAVIMLQTELLFPNYPAQHPPQTFSDRIQSRTARIQRWSRLTKVFFVPSAARARIPAKTEQLLGSIKTQGGIAATDTQSDQPDPQNQRIEDLWARRKVNRTARDYLMCKEFIDSAHASGVRIVILDMPVSVTTLSIVPPDYLEDRSNAVNKLLSGNDFYLRFTKPLSDENFWDYSHLTVRGRSVFFRWLVENFAQHNTGS